MKLPKLPELPNLDIVDGIENKQDKIKTLSEDVNEKKKVKKARPRIPKSEYDAEGKPVLMIPDIDDVSLNAEIDKYFGEQEED